jgi:hypothetical protein
MTSFPCRHGRFTLAGIAAQGREMACRYKYVLVVREVCGLVPDWACLFMHSR